MISRCCLQYKECPLIFHTGWCGNWDSLLAAKERSQWKYFPPRIWNFKWEEILLLLMQACWLIEEILELTTLRLNSSYAKRGIELCNKHLRGATKRYLLTTFIKPQMWAWFVIQSEYKELLYDEVEDPGSNFGHWISAVPSSCKIQPLSLFSPHPFFFSLELTWDHPKGTLKTIRFNLVKFN